MSTDEFSLDHPDNLGSKALVLLDNTNPTSQFIATLFHDGWIHPNKQRPEIHAIYKILYPEDKINGFVNYRARVDQSMIVECPTPGNERLLFHGTTRACTVVEKTKNIKLCKNSTCYLCSIVRHSFDAQRAGSKFAFRRFGAGIYTSACSSKADDYTTNNSWRSSLRILIVNRVVVGNTLRLQTDTTNLKEPPSGYHSITGEPGVNLNYEETVVYDNDAIRPAYLIVYGDELKLMDLVNTVFSQPLAA